MCLCKAGLDSVLFSSHYSSLHNLSKALQAVKGQSLPGLLFLFLSYGVLCLPSFTYMNHSWMTQLWKYFTNRLLFWSFFFLLASALSGSLCRDSPLSRPAHLGVLPTSHRAEFPMLPASHSTDSYWKQGEFVWTLKVFGCLSSRGHHVIESQSSLRWKGP